MSVLKAVVEAAARRGDVIAAVDALYADVQAAIDQRRPVCVMSGKCCRFEEYGHRLFVTTMELAAFVSRVSGVRSTALTTGGIQGSDGKGCPFQQNKLCTVHTIRPFGCRMLFCDPTSTHWPNEVYERFHARLKALHEELGMPYFYVEWRVALGALWEG
jgi:Fe-S-cluster containining protein